MAVTFNGCVHQGCTAQVVQGTPLCAEHTPAKNKRRHSHYYRVLPCREVDLYRLLKAFNVTDPCLQHAAKKIFFAGERGTKSFRKDVLEAGDSISRCLEMLTEEEFPEGDEVKRG
jgi:hypothetical protein